MSGRGFCALYLVVGRIQYCRRYRGRTINSELRVCVPSSRHRNMHVKNHWQLLGQNCKKYYLLLMYSDKMENGVWLVFILMEDYDSGTYKILNVTSCLNSVIFQILIAWLKWGLF